MGKKFKDLMIDIETMGTNPNSSILSIAAIEFNIDTGEIGKEFYTNICLQSCKNLGLDIEPSTVLWWMNQNESARKKLIEEPGLSIIEALKSFNNFIQGNYKIWANSPAFDCEILKNAFKKSLLPIPWNFWDERDVRTLVSIYPEIKQNCTFKGTGHNALDDCKHQIEYCTLIWKKIHNE